MCSEASRNCGNGQPVCLVVVIDYADDDVALIASMKMYPDSMKVFVCVCV